jgi:hypothetical protein
VREAFGLVAGRVRRADWGGFRTRDPAVPLTAQAYSYVNNNPLNAIDPRGLWTDNPWVDVGLVLGAVALAATGVGLFVEGTALVAGITATIAGAGAVALDVQPCREGDPYACGGAVMGGAGVISGLGGVGVLGYEAVFGATADTAAVGTALGVEGLALGGIGTGVDTIGAYRGGSVDGARAEGPSCGVGGW